MNSTIARRTYPAVLRVEGFFFLDDVELLFRAVDPLEEFDAALDGEGDPEGDEEDDGVCVGEPVGEEGEVEGAMLVLKGFPSFLKFGMLSSFGGTGPENILFSTFKSLRERSCKTSRVPDSLLSCMCNVVSDAKLPNEGGNGPLKLLEEISRFTSSVRESNVSGSFPSRWLSFSDMAVRLWSFDNDTGMLPVSWLSERKIFCSVTGRSSGMLPPILLLLRFISVIEVKFPRLPRLRLYLSRYM